MSRWPGQEVVPLGKDLGGAGRLELLEDFSVPPRYIPYDNPGVKQLIREFKRYQRECVDVSGTNAEDGTQTSYWYDSCCLVYRL